MVLFTVINPNIKKVLVIHTIILLCGLLFSLCDSHKLQYILQRFSIVNF